jgi:hypothetical protein
VADHPYTSAEDRAFWSRAVARSFDVGSVADRPPFVLSTKDTFMSAGSCFAANIRPFLEARGCHYTVTEGPHPQWPEGRESTFYEAFSARYGNVYTARQMVQLLRRAAGTFSPSEEYWQGPQGDFIDPFRPGLLHRATSLPEFRALTAQHLRAVRRAVESSSVLVFTLGLTEAWMSADDGAIFPACPGTVAGDFDPVRHRFVNFSVDEVADDIHQMVALLRDVNPAIRVILTVSPVPLVATATGRHVLTATAYSKSVLRVAADQAARRDREVVYFPAYEIVTGPHFRVPPFEDDLRSVRQPIVAAVMTGFFAAFFAPGGPAAPQVSGEPSVPVNELVAEALAAECEEMMADEQLRSDEEAGAPVAPSSAETDD